MISVVSTNVRAVGYDDETHRLRVAFRSGGVYDYLNVAPSLYFELPRPHPWRRVGHLVKQHRCVRVQAA